MKGWLLVKLWRVRFALEQRYGLVPGVPPTPFAQLLIPPADAENRGNSHAA